MIAVARAPVGTNANTTSGPASLARCMNTVKSGFLIGMRTPLGVVGFRPAVVADDDLDLDARRQLVGVLLHIEFHAPVDQLAERRERTRGRIDQTDFYRLRARARSGERQAERQ